MERIVIRTGKGEMRAVYTEKVDLRRIAPRLGVERASCVEFDERKQGWTVEFPESSLLLPFGSVLSRDGNGWYASLMKSRAAVFARREEALAAEAEFLQAVIAAGSYDCYMSRRW